MIRTIINAFDIELKNKWLKKSFSNSTSGKH